LKKKKVVFRKMINFVFSKRYIYAAKYAKQCSLCSCLIPTFSKFNL